MSKRVNGHLYTLSCIKYDKSSHKFYYDYLEDNRLFSHSDFTGQVYSTKLTKADLPEYFVYGRFYKNWGYLSAKGVRDLKFKPNMWINHLIRDDILYVSYYKPIKIVKKETPNGYEYDEYENYTYLIDGWSVIDFLDAVKKYSPKCDTSEVERKLLEKAESYKKNHPEESDCEHIDDWILELKSKYNLD